MKLTCTLENFKKAVYNCEKIVSKQNTLPILNNILFEAEKGGLKLSATNLEVGVVVKIGAKIEKEGKITLPAKLIGNFSTNLPQGEKITIEIINQSVRIKSGSFKVVIKGLLADDFPLIPKENTEALFNLNGVELKNVLSRVLISAALSDTRQELTGVNVILTPKEVFFAATDSFRLSEYCLKLKDKDINKDSFSAYLTKKNNIIIPSSTLMELIRIIPVDSESKIKVIIEEGQVFFEVSGTRVVSRLINGKYPEYKHIMPKAYKTKIIGEKEVFQKAVKMASLFATGKSSEITLEIDGEAKKVSVGSSSVEVGESLTEVKFDVSGPSQKIVFNYKYLIDGINTITTPLIALLINSDTTPVALKEVEEDNQKTKEDYTYIVMPIRA